jgi:hypothetical protein
VALFVAIEVHMNGKGFVRFGGSVNVGHAAEAACYPTMEREC